MSETETPGTPEQSPVEANLTPSSKAVVQGNPEQQAAVLQTENQHSTPADPQTRQYNDELASFTKWQETSGNAVPEQFGGDVEKYFQSYKELQSAYTKSRQELADVRREEATSAPASPEATSAAPVEPSEADTAAPDPMAELGLGKEKVAEEPAEAATEAAPRVTTDDMQGWRAELASSGKLSEESIGDIRAKTGFDGPLIDEFVAAQKAIMRDAYQKAADVVQGGPDKLQQVLAWAQETLSVDEARSVDQALQGTTWKTTLLGLEAMYDRSAAETPKAQEPKKYATPDVPMNRPEIKGFASRAEYATAVRDPRMTKDPAYVREVEERAMRTNFSQIPYD